MQSGSGVYTAGGQHTPSGGLQVEQRQVGGAGLEHARLELDAASDVGTVLLAADTGVWVGRLDPEIVGIAEVRDVFRSKRF